MRAQAGYDAAAEEYEDALADAASNQSHARKSELRAQKLSIEAMRREVAAGIVAGGKWLQEQQQQERRLTKLQQHLGRVVTQLEDANGKAVDLDSQAEGAFRCVDTVSVALHSQCDPSYQD